MPRGKLKTERDVTMALCFALMSSRDFTTVRRREWTIWAAKVYFCQDCKQAPGMPCISLADLKNRDTQKQLNPKINKWPHDSRVDWDRMLVGLKERGYYSPVIEDQVRRRMTE